LNDVELKVEQVKRAYTAKILEWQARVNYVQQSISELED
jgi:hypothetical protein